MAFVNVNLDVVGEKQWSRGFELMAREAADISEPLRHVGRLIVESVGQQFMTEGAHGLGGRWQPLSPEYERWKEENFPGRPLLVRTGAMRRTVLDPGSLTVTARRLVYEPRGEHDDLAYYHQVGAGALPDMPPRKLVALPESVRRSMDRAFHEWVVGLRRGAMGRAA